MRFITTYIVKKLTFMFFSIIFMSVILLLGVDIAEHVNLFSKHSLSEITKYYMSLMIIIFTFSIPFSVSLSIAIVIIMMKKTNEWGAMLTLGVGKNSLKKTAYAFGGFVLILAFLFMELLLPPSAKRVIETNKSESIERVKEGAPFLLITGKTVMGAKKLYTEKKTLKEIFLIENFGSERHSGAFIAENGEIDNSSIKIKNPFNIFKNEFTDSITFSLEKQIKYVGSFQLILLHNFNDLIQLMMEYSFTDIIFSRYSFFFLWRILYIFSVLLCARISFNVASRESSFSPSETLAVFSSIFVSLCIIFSFFFFLAFFEIEGIFIFLFDILLISSYFFLSKFSMWIYNFMARIIGVQ